MPRPAPLPPRRRERGSAYIVALLVLVLLTIFGMSLALITQTESQIGAAEKVATRTLFAADSGFGVAVARKQVTSAEAATTYDIHTRTSVAGVAVTERVATSPFVQVNLALCTLCSLNETQVQGNQYRRTNHVVNATGEVRGAQGADVATSSSKLLSLMLEFQPVQATIPAELDTTAQETLARTLVY
jgi:Tfp pilus assembly protein PilX